MQFPSFFRLLQIACLSIASVCLLPVAAQTVTPKPLTPLPASSPPPPAFKPDPAYTAEALAKRYPAQSITSIEMADKALADVKKGREQANELLKREEKECYKTFFATRCVDQAKERRRNALIMLRPIQVEADRYKRHQKVIKRERAMQEQQDKKPDAKALEEKEAENKAAYQEKQRRREVAQKKALERKAKTERRRKEKAEMAAKRAKSRKAAMEQAGIVSAPASKPASASSASTTGSAASSNP